MKRRLFWLGAILLASAAGCQRSDAEALASIGSKIMDRTQGYFDHAQQKWPGLPAAPGLASRVNSRLRFDKALAETSIEVVAQEKSVELKGTVATQDQARRAVELAESTAGVENVVNSLQVQ